MQDNTLNRGSIEYRALDSFDYPVSAQEIKQRMFDYGLPESDFQKAWCKMIMDFWLESRDGLWFKNYQGEGDAPPWKMLDESKPEIEPIEPSAITPAMNINYCPNCGCDLAGFNVANKAVKEPENKKTKKAKVEPDDGLRKVTCQEIVDFINTMEPGTMFPFLQMRKIFLQSHPDARPSSASAALSIVHRTVEYAAQINAGKWMDEIDGIERRTFGAADVDTDNSTHTTHVHDEPGSE